MDIDQFEFEEELTQSALADMLEKLADEIRRGESLELPMPSLREGVITLPFSEPIETGIEVKIRKSKIRLNIALGWTRLDFMEEGD